MKYADFPVGEIVVANRTRKELGELLNLTCSIERVGLLHPVVLNAKHELIAGGRRLAAVKKLGWATIPTVIVDNLEDAILALAAERDENTCRKPWTASELAEMGRRLEELEKPKAEERHRQGSSSGGQGAGKLPEPSKGDTRDVVGEALGVSGKTYEKAKAIAETAIDPLKAMVDTEQVSIDAAATVAKLSATEQAKIVAKGPDAVKKAAKASRQAKAKTKPEPVSQPEPADKDSGTGVQTEPAAEPADELDTLLNRIKQLIKTSPELAEPAADELQTLAGYAAELAPAPPIDKRIVTLCRKLDGIAADMDAWKDDPLSYTISFITVQGGIKNVRTALWASRPCCQCPYCTGTGKHPRHGERCKGCKGTGLVTKTTEKSGKAAMGAA